MLVTRDGDDTTFWVNDCPQTANHRFWQDYFASGTWEAFTLDTIDTYVTPDSTYVDIGAWVGPTVLWAARRGGRVVAAYQQRLSQRLRRQGHRRPCCVLLRDGDRSPGPAERVGRLHVETWRW
jgi:hypothetical protein